MVPKKAKEFKKDTAAELNLSEDFVSTVIDLYWQKVRKHLSAINSTALEVPNLGTFKVKEWKLDEVIKCYHDIINDIEGKFTKYETKIEMEKQVEQFEKVKRELQEEKEKFKKIKEAKYGKKTNDNLEE